MRWKKTSEPAPLEIGPVTTSEDVRAQRRLREEVRPFPLDRIDDLSPADLFPYPPNRGTPLGWEPFDLQSPPEAPGDRETGRR